MRYSSSSILISRAAVLAEQNAVAWFHVERNQFAFFALASANGDDFALHGLFFCGVGDDDAALDGFLFFNALHDDTVVQRCRFTAIFEKPPFR